MNPTPNHIAQQKAQQLKNYASGSLSAQERHTLEKQGWKDAFEEESFEGWQMVGNAKNAPAIINELQNSIRQRVAPTSIVSLPAQWKQLAAMVTLLLVTGVALWWAVAPSLQTAEKMAINQKQPTPPASAPSPLVRSAEAAPPKETKSIASEENTLPVEANEVVTKKPTPSTIVEEPMPTDGFAQSVPAEEVEEAPNELVALDDFGENMPDEEQAISRGEENTVAASGRPENLEVLPDSLPNETIAVENSLAMSFAEEEMERDDLDGAFKEEAESKMDEKRKRENTSSAAPKKYGYASALNPKKGWQKFQQYLDKNRSPFPEELEKQLPVTINLRFRTENGRPTSVKPEERNNSAFELEAIRLLKEGPDWEPANTQVPRLISVGLRPKK